MKAAALLVLLLAITFVAAEERHHGHGPKTGGPHPTYGGNGGQQGNYVYRACHEDLAKFCPGLHPSTAKELFTSECFKEHEQDLSPACHQALNDFRTNEGQTIDNGGVAVDEVHQFCKVDQLRLCPSLPEPWTERELFEASCFKTQIASVSTSCKNLYEKFNLNRHFVLGILVSGSVMVLASGALSILVVCCCVACCVRMCVKRRCRSRRCSWKKVKTVDETELVPSKSVNYDPLQAEEAALPQTQFVFPPQQAFNPYTSHPQYMPVPVFTMTQQ